MNHADIARERRITDQIKSEKECGSGYSTFGRLLSTHVQAAAARIARAYPNKELSIEDLRRALLVHEQLYPAAFKKTSDVSAAISKARFEEQQPVIVRDITTSVLNKLTALEKLHFVNTGGELPSRFVRKGPLED